MKYCFRLTSLLFFFYFSLNCIKAFGQQPTLSAKNGMTAGIKNYKSFSAIFKDKSSEVAKANAGYERHPELGLLFAEAPCDNCYELINKRTEISKTFIKKGTGGRDIMLQTSSAPMHYHDAEGNWKTIKSQLQPGGKGIYSASEQPVPVTVNTAGKYASLGKANENIRFNNNLELLYASPNGTIASLGKANWSHFTAGDDGVYVTNAWPGIDIEMYTIRGAIKTNYILNKAMPAYAAGKLLVRDHLEMSTGLMLNAHGLTTFAGNLEVTNGSGEPIYNISAATAFEKNALKSTFKMLEYSINGNVLDIILPGNFLNRSSSSYPVIIDPLTSASTNSTVTGSTYSAGFTTGCIYNNAATVPAQVTVTDVQFSFQYIISGGAALDNGAFDFKLGACRSPSPTTLWWSCNSTNNVVGSTCTATNASIFPSLATCMPAPQCTQYNLNLVMEFYQNFATTATCSNLYVYAGSPLNITVFGHTIESTTAAASPTVLCQGQSSSLSATTQNGVAPYTYTWTPGSLVGSTVNVSPAVTTVYTVTAKDACGGTDVATATVTVNPVSAITGNTQVCAGSTMTLSDAATGGTWSSSNTAVATIGNGGIVSGITTGTSVISYITPTTCYATAIVTVNPLPAAITGNTNICAGGTTNLSDATAGGTWSSSNTTVATVTNAGLVSGGGSGTATVSYTSSAGCTKTINVIVSPIQPITGGNTECLGSTLTLANATPGGGTWSSASTTVATINNSGVLTGVSAGTSVIRFTTAAGCFTTNTITVLPLPTSIIGVTTVCQGNTTALSDQTTGGIWTSGNTGIAAVNASTGSVSGISGGTAVISYTSGGCVITTSVNVSPLGPITGNTTVCVGGTSTLINIAGTGTWTSTNTSVATVNLTTGVVSGVSTGASNITYTSTSGCIAATTVNVITVTAISGSTTVCQGGTTILSDATTGGSWSSSNTVVAQVPASSGVVTGISGGTATITYTTAGGCYVTQLITVNPVAPITGTTTICQGSSSILSDATPGGTWSVTNTSIATVMATTGQVYGAASGGITSVVYTTGAACSASVPVSIVALPAAITGNIAVCNIGTLSDATTGGTWTSNNTAVASIGLTTGAITGTGTGSATITYTIGAGCAVTTTVSVNPVLPITGPLVMCAHSNIILSDATSSGTWSSSNTNIATVNANTGVVTGVSGGVSNISYSTTAGCTVTTAISVNPISGINGYTTVCQQSNITLSDATLGGTWSSGTPGIAAIGINSGIVSGLLAGTALITYTMPTGCAVTTTMTVNPISPIAGISTVCASSSTFLSDAITGGTWSSNNTAVAGVGPNTGVVTGISSGNTAIIYTTLQGCTAITTVTVNTLPSAITGNTTVCQNSNTTLSDTPAGGTWSSVTPGVAVIGFSSGIVTGIASGTSQIIYTTFAGCTATATITVNSTAPITGITNVCQGSSLVLSNAVAGGTWSSANTAIATVDLNLGVVYGIAAGTTGINYTTAAGCVISTAFTVNVMPTAIAGNTTVCQGSTTTLSNSVSGGTWGSGSPAIAAIGANSGTITTGNSGTSVITYATVAGCAVTATVTVNPLTAISGITSVCQGSITSLTDATPNGTWSSANTSIATADINTGNITGVAAGVANIMYTTPLGCFTTIPMTVNPLPSAIAGNTTLCVGTTTTLSNSITGGTWSSGTPATATIGTNNGILTSGIAGTTVVTYTTSFGCALSATVTVNPLPATITGSTSICSNGFTMLSDATLNGMWTIGNTAVATINASSGLLTGIAAGTAVATYTSLLNCTTTATVVVNPVPTAIAGIPVVCEGYTQSLSDALAGGTWSSDNNSIATIGVTSGILGGVAAGAARITYITPSGCFAATTATVNPTPRISGFTLTNPTTCVTNDGTITLNGLTPGANYIVNYYSSGIPFILSLNANSFGNVVLTGLAAGTYSNFTATSALGCTSNVFAGPAVLTLPAPPQTPVAGSNTPICDGTALNLTATDATAGVVYSWTGPQGFISGSQNPVINSAHVNESGTYTVTATKVGCVSAPATTTVVINPIPDISGITATNPTTCYGTDGTITLTGLTAGLSFYVTYISNGNPVGTTLTANGNGDLIITGLASGAYTDFSVSSFTCVSNSVGPVILSDPSAPPPPTLGSNSPICSGDTLLLSANDPVPNLIYNWIGPNGFTSDQQNPRIPNVAMADSGEYTLTISHLNCLSGSSERIIIYPPVVLTDVTQNQEMPYGGYIQLNASGALLYIWSPNDGSISNPNIYNPVAAPTDSTTYTVIGMNTWGCRDSAHVTITINFNAYEFVPSAFTPNGDGKNDIFRIVNQKFVKLVDFSVFDRWGKMVYHNTYDAKAGWDGNYNGVAQDMGVYFYSITVVTPDGNTKYYKGDVTLIR